MKFTYATLMSLILTLSCAALWICGYVTEELDPQALNMLVLFFFGMLGVTLLTMIEDSMNDAENK